jgi:hypothetical protein
MQGENKGNGGNQGGSGSAAGTGNEGKDLVGFRKDHILNGHKSGAGKGKSEFPSSWSDERIIEEVNKIANNPNAPSGMGKWNSPYKTGIVDGIEIRVDYYPLDHATYQDVFQLLIPGL